MSGDEQLTLRPRVWVALPGTGYEIMVHGKFTDTAERIVVTRDGTGPGGWDLNPVHGRYFVRQVRS